MVWMVQLKKKKLVEVQLNFRSRNALLDLGLYKFGPRPVLTGQPNEMKLNHSINQKKP